MTLFSDLKVGFVSYFLQGGYGNRVIYDKKGRWLYSILLYSEDRLHRDIRNQIKSVYFDFEITLVQEIQTAEGTEYMVYLRDKSTILFLKVGRAGDMTILRELTRE